MFVQTKLLEEFPEESGVKNPSKRILPFLPGVMFAEVFYSLVCKVVSPIK